MTKTQAKKIILQTAAAELRGSGWPYLNREKNEPYTKSEQKKIEAALEELCTELERRAEKIK